MWVEYVSRLLSVLFDVHIQVVETFAAQIHTTAYSSTVNRLVNSLYTLSLTAAQSQKIPRRQPGPLRAKSSPLSPVEPARVVRPH